MACPGDDESILPIVTALINMTILPLVNAAIAGLPGPCISKMYSCHWKPSRVSERMWSVNLDASISGEYQTLGEHYCRTSE